MRPTVSLIGALIWLLLTPIRAEAAVSATLNLDRYEATLSDAVRLTVGVSGTKSCDAPPQIKGLKTFRVSQGGTSSRVEIVNGQYTAQLDYVYFIQPSKTGAFNIGPAHVKVDGKAYESNTATLHVGKASAPKGPEADIFLTASLSAKTAYVEEEVLYVLKLYLRKRVSDISLSLPETNHLGFKQLEKPKEYRATAHGHSYGVVELKYSLIPDKPGAYTIEPAEIDLTVYDASRKGRRGLFDDPFFDDPFFRRGRPLRVLSEPGHLTVRELPAAGRPQDFSGLVGTLKMTSSLEPTRLRVGESATLTVRLTGKGNVNRMPDLTLPEIDGMKVYADEPAFTITPGPKGLSGLKVMKWALVPEAAGTYRIPPTTVSFFDKAKNRYETRKTSLRTLEVLPKKGENRAVMRL
ncbi:MAG: BatD family protein [Deltaproteobacteria bacterium]|nr:BatD family protein [Deltaproteobacteria bacterium]